MPHKLAFVHKRPKRARSVGVTVSRLARCRALTVGTAAGARSAVVAASASTGGGAASARSVEEAASASTDGGAAGAKSAAVT